MSAKGSPRVVTAGRIPAGGKNFHIVFDEAERLALATALGIAEVMELRAELGVRPLAGQAYGVEGSLTASVVQTDVVTLEPLRQEVDVAIDLTLVPAEDAADADTQPRSAEIGDEPERDTFSGGRIDLGAIVAEHLALGLDPYPRAPGVEFPGHVEDDSAVKVSPFAVLAPLKHKPE